MSDLDALRLIDPRCYAEHGYPHDLWTELRRESPVCFFGLPGWPPFWAITKHADIVEVSKQPDVFLNAPGMSLVRERKGNDVQQQIKTVINMDPPEHRKYRAVASPFFSPRALRQLDSLVRETARGLVDGLGREGECDFITEIATQHPLKIIAGFLASVLHHAREVRPELHEHLADARAAVLAALELGVLCAEELVGEFEDERLVRLGDTEDARDDLQRML